MLKYYICCNIAYLDCCETKPPPNRFSLLGGVFYSVYYSALVSTDSNTNPSSVCLQTYLLPEVM